MAEPSSLQPDNSRVTPSSFLLRFLFLMSRICASIVLSSSVWLKDESTSWKSSSDSELTSLYGRAFFLHSLYGLRPARVLILGRFSPGLTIRQVCSVSQVDSRPDIRSVLTRYARSVRLHRDKIWARTPLLVNCNFYLFGLNIIQQFYRH